MTTLSSYLINKVSALRYVGRLILLAAAAGAFWLNIGRAQDEGLFTNTPIAADWLVDVVPGALSNMFAPSAPRYTVSDAVADAYFGLAGRPPDRERVMSPGSGKAVNTAIGRVSREDFHDAKPGYTPLFGPNDKGIVDFMEFAFRIFGLRIESVAFAYYALLLVSSLLFSWRYITNSMAMVALTAVLFAEFQVLPYLVFNPPLASPLALRCLPILSIVACVHCALHYWKMKVTAADLIALSVQVLIIVFVLHMRTTAIWQPLLLLGLGGFLVLRRLYRQWYGRPVVSGRLFAGTIMPLLLMVVGLVAFSTYRALAFPPAMTPRMIWHSIYAGFGLHPKLAADYRLRVDDGMLIDQVGRVLKGRGEIELWRRIGGESMSPDYHGLDWTLLDPAERGVILQMCRQETRYCFETFIIYKPYFFYDTLLWYYGVNRFPAVADTKRTNGIETQIRETTAYLRGHGLTAAPWGSGFLWLLAPLIVGVLLQTKKSQTIGIALPVTLALTALASLLPSLLGFPIPHGMADSVVAINAALQLMAIYAAVRAIQSATGRTGIRSKSDAR